MSTPDDPPRADTPPRKPRRLTADYRWTVPKVTAFLEALAQSGRVADAARAVGMSRQAAYKLRARLDGPRFRAAFEGARKTGTRARTAASLARLQSRWDGPGLATLDHLRASSGPAPGVPQGDTSHRQGDIGRAQGDTGAPQGDAPLAQGDAFLRKATKHRLDRVTPGPCPTPTGASRSAAPLAGPRAACENSRRTGTQEARMTGTIETRRFDTPDQHLDMKDAGGIRIVQLKGGASGMHAVFEPGWTWEKDEKPLLGNRDTCPMHHTGYSLSGELVVRMVERG